MSHKVTVTRIPGSHYEAWCEECGLIGYTPTSKSKLMEKALEHEVTGGAPKEVVRRVAKQIARIISEPVPLSIQHRPIHGKLYGHSLERENVCGGCGGPLRDQHGMYRQRMEGSAVVSICQSCASSKLVG